MATRVGNPSFVPVQNSSVDLDPHMSFSESLTIALRKIVAGDDIILWWCEADRLLGCEPLLLLRCGAVRHIENGTD